MGAQLSLLLFTSSAESLCYYVIRQAGWILGSGGYRAETQV